MKFNIPLIRGLYNSTLHRRYGDTVTWKWFDRVSFPSIFFATMPNLEFYNRNFALSIESLTVVSELNIIMYYVTDYFWTAWKLSVSLVLLIALLYIALYSYMYIATYQLYSKISLFLYLNVSNVIILIITTLHC